MNQTVTPKQQFRVTKRGVQLALGCLWLLDGLLQLQPRMFTAAFANQVIAPAAQGQPLIVSGPMHFFMTLFLWHPALSNTGIALVQIGLGGLILWKRTVGLGLRLSVAWGLFVWLVGEGLSGLASGHALLLMGSPGAALIYALLALGVLTGKDVHDKTVDTRPAYWLLAVWVAVWAVGAVYQVLPGQNTVADVSSMISANASSAPRWLASIDTKAANYIGHFGTATARPDSMAGMPGMNMSASQPVVTPAYATSHKVSGFWFLLLIAILQLIIAFAVIIPGFVRLLAVVLGCLLSLGFWIIGQSLGSYYTGVATDPNTGPLLILLGVAVLGCTQRDSAVKAYFARKRSGFLDELRALNEP